MLILASESIALVDRFFFKIIVDRGTEFVQGSYALSLFTHVLIIIAVLFVALSLSRSIIKFAHLHLINRLDAYLIRDLKQKFFNHILTLSYRFHTTHKTGSLISRLVRGGRSIELMTDIIIFNFAPLLFQLVLVGGALLYFDWVPALIVVTTILSFIAYSYGIQKIMQPHALRANDFEDVEKGKVSDFLTNIDSIKLFGKEPSIMERFRAITERTKNYYLRYWDYYRPLDAGQNIILATGTFGLVFFAIIDVLQGTMSLGTLVFIFTAYDRMLPSLYGFVRGLRDYYHVMADFESLFQYYKIENEIKDLPDAKPLKIKEGSVEFRNVAFGYYARMLLKNFSLKIPQNKKIALVGHSGSGKTTLIKLLYRLYEAKAGQILIDGQDLRTVRQESLRSELSIVPQECVLFDDTIYNNIAFSNPSASKKDIWKAMKFAQLDNVVRNFPQKENTIVGERGVRLSGGEKQRVSIARAILANKKILVLDEATSSLDSKTEYEIQQDLERLIQGRTTIIIAHRLSTVMKADLIVVLDKGNIVQTGTHQELISRPGMYQQLWNIQKGGYLC